MHNDRLLKQKEIERIAIEKEEDLNFKIEQEKSEKERVEREKTPFLYTKSGQPSFGSLAFIIQRV